MAAVPPLEWNDDNIESVISHFLTEEVNQHASPGIPYAHFGKTNKIVLASHRELIVRLVKDRLRRLATEDCLDLSAEERVQQGFCDPVRLFVKDEPHSHDKIKTKRLRLIMSISLVDQLVERVLNYRLNQSELASWQHIPSKGGSSMSKFADRMHVADWMRGRDLAEGDISGFDWSVKAWELRFDADLRIALSPGAGVFWKVALLQRVDCLSLSVFSLSDGTMIAQRVKGIQKSGSYNTTSTNSHIRVMLAHLAGAEEAIALGDDGLEDYSPQAVSIYESLGHLLKMYERKRDRASFCSMDIDEKGHGEPLTWHKTFFRFLDAKVKTPERLYQLYFVLGESCHWNRIHLWLLEQYRNISWAEGATDKIGKILESWLDGTQEEFSNKSIAADQSQDCCYPSEAPTTC